MSAAGRDIHVLIADDQTLFRSGLAQLLSAAPRIHIAGEASDGAEALRLAHRLKPDVVLMDLRMPNMDGVEATRRIVKDLPETRVLILSTFDTESYVMQALKSGAHGYVLKDSSPQSIAAAVVSVYEGEHVTSASVAARVRDLATGAQQTKSQIDGLTAREVEILRLIAEGIPNKQIAKQLGISEKTARNHISNMYEKLGIYDRAQIVLYAVRKGLVEP